MATKCKPQGTRFKKFEIWTKMAKVPKPQGPKWQFTLFFVNLLTYDGFFCCYFTKYDGFLCCLLVLHETLFVNVIGS
ncbi:hypothetical protein Hanom_Chr02g00108721 [Helianthus anomalus]